MYRKITIFEYSYKIAVLVMTEIVLAHDQKYIPGHYFSVGPNASPKRTPNFPYNKTYRPDGLNVYL